MLCSILIKTILYHIYSNNMQQLKGKHSKLKNKDIVDKSSFSNFFANIFFIISYNTKHYCVAQLKENYEI